MQGLTTEFGRAGLRNIVGFSESKEVLINRK